MSNLIKKLKFKTSKKQESKNNTKDLDDVINIKIED